MFDGYISDVDGIEVGHSDNKEAMTGCTVILAREGATGGVDVRGSAPGTRETDLFQERKSVDRIHAIVLAGGSAFGLDASGGVMKYLEEEGIGFDTGYAKVPIVASAVIYDLALGRSDIRPDFAMGYEACKNISSDRDQGNVGCGIGASVGKILGMDSAMKSGLGSASLSCGKVTVGAIVSVNAAGDIYEYESKKKIAGVFDYRKNEFLDTVEIMKEGYKEDLQGMNTTIAVVATNAILDKAQANKLAEISHNGYAKSIRPVHTTFDGDTIFSLATNKVIADINLVGVLAVDTVSMAISNAIYAAESYGDIKSYTDLISK